MEHPDWRAALERASMGPRHAGRGIDERAGYRAYWVGASMGPRHAGRGIVHQRRCNAVVSQRFNGSTARGPWYRSGTWPNSHASLTLQWVHGTRAVVSARSTAWAVVACAASMGPRHAGRGIVQRVSRWLAVKAASMGPR